MATQTPTVAELAIEAETELFGAYALTETVKQAAAFEENPSLEDIMGILLDKIITIQHIVQDINEEFN